MVIQIPQGTEVEESLWAPVELDYTGGGSNVGASFVGRGRGLDSGGGGDGILGGGDELASREGGGAESVGGGGEPTME